MAHLPSKNRITAAILPLAPYLLLATGVISVLLRILSLDHGKVTYSLDDCYIHLALAQRIFHGTYGINPGQTAAPASSLLWPFLLAPFAWTPFFEYVPLLLNLVFAALAVKIYHTFAYEILDGLAEAERAASAAGIAILLVPTTNLVGLIFTGMEHTLQVMLCAAILLGLVRLLRNPHAPTPAWLVAALILAPLTRYECLVISLPVIALLLLQRRWKACALALAGITLPIAAFSWFLHAHGLGWLPTSVLAKVTYGESQPSQNFILSHLRNNLAAIQGRVLGLLLIASLALLILRKNAARIDRLVNAVLCVMLLGHLSAGQIGWADRYEVYMLAAAALLLLYLLRQPLVEALRRYTGKALGGLTLISLLIAAPYYLNMGYTPWLVVNIYEQQYQMHRFVVDYVKAPVAVNDLGWVAFDNPNPVLDLWGLASKEALDQRSRAPMGGAWMEDLAARQNVRLVMIYDSWFPRRPASWQAIARLHLGHRRTIAGGDPVTFYARSAADAEALRPLLEDFAQTLPDGVRLELVP